MRRIILFSIVIIAAICQFWLSSKLGKQWKGDIQSGTGIGVLDFEFANGKYRDSIFYTLHSTPQLKAAVQQHFSTDTKYIFAYVSLLAGLVFLFMFQNNAPFKKSFYIFLAIAAIGAGILDAVENNRLLKNIEQACCYKSSFLFSFSKFLLLGFVILSLLYNLIYTIICQLKSK